jgi:hypothetical protein
MHCVFLNDSINHFAEIEKLKADEKEKENKLRMSTCMKICLNFKGIEDLEELYKEKNLDFERMENVLKQTEDDLKIKISIRDQEFTTKEETHKRELEVFKEKQVYIG